MHDVLQWLPLSQCIQFRTWVWRCPIGSALVYLREFCCPTSELATCKNVHSASGFEHLVPFVPFQRHNIGHFLRLGHPHGITSLLICMVSYQTLLHTPFTNIEILLFIDGVDLVVPPSRLSGKGDI